MLLQGDALAVQLFIGAAALTALSVAMTQAGWTHKWFVRGMFGLAGTLALASVGWPYIELRIPLINDALQAVASSRVAWFFMGIIPASVAGMLLATRYVGRREATKAPRKWLPTFIAMERLARQDLLDRFQYVVSQSEDAFDKKEALNQQIEKLEKVLPFAGDAVKGEMVERLVRLSAERDVFKKKATNGSTRKKIALERCI